MKDQIVIERRATTEADSILHMESLIKNQVEAIRKLRDERQKTREQFDDSFNNNRTFREHTEKVKEVTKSKNSIRAEILKQPSVARLQQKVKDLNFDINEKEKTLSDLLLDYKEQTGATQLTLIDGMEVQIVMSAKLVRHR
jgi:seryl-tRNA synthetase